MNGLTVLIIVIDALRQDHVGCYGYKRPTTPCIDLFAENAFVLNGVIPQSSWTRPSIASLLTSLYPEEHGIFDFPDKLNSGLMSLPKVLKKEKNFHTMGIVTNPNVFRKFGFDGHFDSFQERYLDDWGCLQAFKDSIQVLNKNKNVFSYVHLFGPHTPYDAPPFYKGLFISSGMEPKNVKISDMYDADVTWADFIVGEMLEFVRTDRDWNKSLIIITSDHGEELFDHHMFGHGHTLFGELLQVPFIMKLQSDVTTGFWGREDHLKDGIYEMIDVAPTICRAIGIVPPSEFKGVCIPSHVQGEFNVAYSSLGLKDAFMQSLTSKNYKFIWDHRFDDEVFVFDRPGLEVIPLVVNPFKGKEMEIFCGHSMEPIHDKVEAILGEDELQQLEALGYVGK